MEERTSTPAVFPCGAPSGGGGGGSGSRSSGGGGESQGAQGFGGMLFPIAIFILVFYFMIIRPQNKRKKQQDALIGGITRGDQVITNSGIFGTVREVRDDSFMVEVADGVKIRILKHGVQTKRAPTSSPAAEEKKD